MENMTKVREFIVENFLFGDGDEFKNDTPFFENGIVDSTGILEIISFLEETFQINIEDEELIPENFSTVQTIDKYLSSKLCLHKS